MHDGPAYPFMAETNASASRRGNRRRQTQDGLDARLQLGALDLVAHHSASLFFAAEEEDERRARGDPESRGKAGVRLPQDLQESELAGEPLRH